MSVLTKYGTRELVMATCGREKRSAWLVAARKRQHGQRGKADGKGATKLVL